MEAAAAEKSERSMSVSGVSVCVHVQIVLISATVASPAKIAQTYQWVKALICSPEALAFDPIQKK